VNLYQTPLTDEMTEQVVVLKSVNAPVESPDREEGMPESSILDSQLSFSGRSSSY